MSDPEPTARILCRTGVLAGQTQEIARESVIGSGSDNQVVLASPLISRRHARIYSEGGTFWLEDLGSTNGTKLDGIQVRRAVRLERLQVITFSESIDFVFVLTDAGPGAHGHGTIIDPGGFDELPDLHDVRPEEAARSGTVDAAGPASSEAVVGPAEDEGPMGRGTVMDVQAFDVLPDLLEKSPSRGEEGSSADGGTIHDPSALAELPELQAVSARGGSDDSSVGVNAESASFQLSVTIPGGGLTHYPLSVGKNTVGRSSDCDVVISGDMFISRKHAVIEVSEGHVVIRDLGGGNGTWIGDSEIDEHILEPGDIFRLGPHLEFTLECR